MASYIVMSHLLLLIVTLLLFFFQVLLADSGETPALIRLTEGDSLYLSWQAEDGPLTACSVVTPNGPTIPLGPNLSEGRAVYSGAGLANGVCGMRADNVSNLDKGSWILTATGQSITTRSTSVFIYGATYEGPKRNITVKISDYLSVKCGPDDDVLYCELTSPFNTTTVIRMGKCQLSIYPVESRNDGTWKCRFLMLYQSFIAHDTTVVKINTDIKNFVIGQNETESEHNIFCSHLTKTLPNTAYCSIQPPNGLERMSLAPGQGLSRYRFFGFAPFHCGVAVKKPLLDAEYGRWLCEMVYTSKGHKGGWVDVQKTGTKLSGAVKPSEDQPSIKVVLSNSEKLSLLCSVPNSLAYCWLQHPNGTVFSTNPIQAYKGYKYYGAGYDFGECGMILETPQLSDSGQWICGMGLETDKDVDTQEVTSKINVLISELPLAPHLRTVTAKKGRQVVVGCGMVHPQAVHYCRFWKPDRTGLSITRSTNTSVIGKYTYAGAGLYTGECFLRISSLQDNDFGSWICAATPLYAATLGGEITTKFEIVEEREGISLAAGFGILAGVAIIGWLATMVFFYRANKKMKKRDSDDSLIPSTALVEVESEDAGPSGTATLEATTRPIEVVAKKRVLFRKRNYQESEG